MIDVWTLIIWLMGSGAQPVVVRDYHIQERCVEVCEEWRTVMVGADCKCLHVLREREDK
jgi:hypothetical protein